jgi:hypothetical protein
VLFSLAIILADGGKAAASSVALSQRQKKRKVAHVEDSEVDDNNVRNTSKTSTSNAAIAAIALSGKKKARKLKTPGTANFSS